MLPEGTVLGGDYRLLRPLSSGGMGSVHLAEQVSTGTRRALKLMHQQLLQNARARERFVQEAKASGRIPSDHVVQVVAAGVDNDLSVPFIVMELLEGETLDRRLERAGPLTADELREVTEQLFHAMCAAHEVGVVHRDLKPENVFLARARRARAQLTVKVLDFGIAKLLAEVSTARTAAIGTPLWMAPEQSDAEQVVSPATDVWALGLLYFYQLGRTSEPDEPRGRAYSPHKRRVVPRRQGEGHGERSPCGRSIDEVLCQRYHCDSRRRQYRNLERVPRFSWCAQTSRSWGSGPRTESTRTRNTP